ncbi:PucR family transcriptional regulator [Sulfobacillus thermosulfidooxidans]|uniref:PucR family transcriptional regulator n=1 Tax=Sulfobacillus thermosulfidooxidans TaxID=28034 RepID=UPI0006B4BBAF|nr:PucR family transcriptional regulator [Sulfobacillus thermosulfidooxidans]
MVRVGDLLNLPSLEGATIAVGSGGQTRPVYSANVMAVPDIAMWAQPGDFLITTGFIFKDQPHVWSSLVQQLADVGVATLAFKPGRFVDEIPKELLQAAEKFQLPIVWLPEHVIFSRAVFEIVEYILSERLASDYHLMTIMRMGLDHGLEAVVHELSRHFNRSVGLFSSGGDLLASSRLGESTMSLPLWMHEEVQTKYSENMVKVISMPEKSDGSSILLALGPRLDNDPRHQGDVYIIRNILSAILVQREITSSVEQKYRDMFFRDWFHGHRYDNQEIESWSRRLGIYLPRPFRMISIISSNEALWHTWTRLVKMEPSLAAKGTLAGDDILLIERADEIASSRLSGILDALDISFVGGWSAEHADWQEVSSAINEARTSRIIAVEKQGTGLLAYDQLGAELILHELSKSSQAASFCQNLFAPLLQYDHQNNTDLLLTLKTYLECRRVKDTAIKLYTHYNTVLYRLARIQEILGMDLNDPEVQFVLQLGIRMMPYFDS